MSMPAKKFKAIIFDMDGVLVDSEEIHLESELMTCRHFGIDAPLSEWESFKGRTGKETFTYLIDNYSPKKLDLGKVIKFNSDAYIDLAKKKIRIFDGVLDFLKFSKKKFEKVALATSGCPVSQQMVFDKFGLHEYFDVVVTGEDVKNSKPHPEPYLKAAALLEHEPPYCTVVEDSVNGIISAKAAGCHAIGITTSFRKEMLISAGADLVISSFQELDGINRIK